MVGLLLYLTTIPLIPHGFFIVTSLLIAIIRRKEVIRVIAENRQFVIGLLIFELACLINFAVHIPQHVDFEVPYFLGIPFAFIIAAAMQRKDLKVLLLLLCVEVGVGLYEYMNGVQSIFASHFVDAELDINLDSELRYYKRVYGLSVGSNTFSLKLLLGLVCANIIKEDLKSGYRWIQGCLIVGLVLAFTRTVILVYAIYLFLYIIMYYKNIYKNAGNRIIIVGAIIVVAIFALLLFSSQFEVLYDMLVMQFTRDSGQIDLSGRPMIWAQFITFIGDNLWLGNGSFRVLMPYYSGMIHAHNSFMQIIANNGIFIGGFFIVLVLSRINKNNWIYIFPILIYSLTQYGIFWGMSYTDVFFFMFLINPNILRKKEMLSSVLK